MIRRLVLAALAALLLAASPAAGADVSVQVLRTPVLDRGDDGIRVTVRIIAAPGERNDVRLESMPGRFGSYEDGTVLVRDAGAPLRAGAGCRAEGDAVRCGERRYGLEKVFADLGDGDDSFSGDPARFALTAAVLGGPGTDSLRAGFEAADIDGGPGDDLVAGGRGGDRLWGGDGTDTLLGGPGADDLAGDDQGVAPDRIDGGPEPRGGRLARDVVIYTGRPASVRVDLADPAPDGAEGEGDVLTGVESVEGSRLADDLRAIAPAAGERGSTLRGGGGDDALTGGPGADILQGERGDDRLAGGDGPDRLEGAQGTDRLDAGGGADVLAASPGDAPLLAGSGDDEVELLGRGRRAPPVRCGSGTDRIAEPPRGFAVPAGCEVVSRFPVLLARPRIDGSALLIGVSFADEESGDPVRISIRTDDGRRVGSGQRSFGPGGHGRVRIPLPVRLRRAVLRRGALLRVDARTLPLGGGVRVRYRIAPVQ